jgi:hypothetical protein
MHVMLGEVKVDLPMHQAETASPPDAQHTQVVVICSSCGPCCTCLSASRTRHHHKSVTHTTVLSNHVVCGWQSHQVIEI